MGCQPAARWGVRDVGATPSGVRRDAEWRAWVPTPRGRPFRLAPNPPALPGLWDLARDREVVPHWTAIFRANARYLIELLAEDGDRQGRGRAVGAIAILERLLLDLESGEAVDRLRTVHDVTLVRENLLRGHELPDVYRALKAREAALCLPRARGALARAWELGGETGSREALVEVLGDLLAGNLFDLGSRWTQEAFRSGELDIEGARAGYRDRVGEMLSGWDAAALARLLPHPRPLEEPPEGDLLFFADNAGADFLLGVLPAVVFWARRWRVVVVVNTLPASSDIAIAEARAHAALLGALPDSPLARIERAGRFALVESGTGTPGIDLRFVGAALNRAARDAAWVLLEGQGRAVETNWTTALRCPALRAAVVKDTRVAGAIGSEAGSPLLRWDEPAAAEREGKEIR
jgi:damage-control phosphatase, subfamily II, stand-alone protein